MPAILAIEQLRLTVEPHADGVKAARVKESYSADDPVALLGLTLRRFG